MYGFIKYISKRIEGEYDRRQLLNYNEYENLDIFTGKVFLYEPYSEEKEKVR